ncbi:MAG TPA: PHB depolymerase family esterase [Pyrinomonadaceae bacterium]|nr:PHB depolymerase family esterase [Pyrinomonadaceae bacterium]
MKKVAFLTIAFLGLIGPYPRQTGAIPPDVIHDTITSGGRKRSYYLFVPDKLKAPAPLVVLLHGSGHNGRSLIDKWQDLAEKEGFIIAGPDSEDPSAWVLGKDGPDFLYDLVEALKSKHPINPRRVYLFGHSGGAVFGLVMSTVASEYFAAVAVHAGAFRSKTEIEMISNVKRKIPISIWVGTSDPFFSLREVRATRDAFGAKDIVVQVNEIPGHDHNYYGIAGRINASAWDFLKQVELSAEPKYSPFGVKQDTARANKLIAEINSLTKTAQELAEQAEAKDSDFVGKEFVKDRAQLKAIALEQAKLFNDSAAAWRNAALNAELASSFSVGRGREHLNLFAEYNRKCAEMIDAMRERAEAFLSDEPLEVITTKRAEAHKRADNLRLQIGELEKELNKSKGGQ